MFKPLFILFVVKQLLDNVTLGIDIYSDKVLSDEGKLSGNNSDMNIVYLKHTNFRVYLFLRAEKIILHEYLCLQMASFWNLRLYKLQPQIKKNKKKTVEWKDMRTTTW